MTNPSNEISELMALDPLQLTDKNDERLTKVIKKFREARAQFNLAGKVEKPKAAKITELDLDTLGI